MRTRKKGVDYIQSRTVEAMQGAPITPSVVRVQDKIKKASETSMLTRALSTNRLQDLTIAEDARKSQKDASGKVVQKYREIYGNQAHLQIQADVEDKRQVVNIREKRLQKPWREKYKKMVKKFVQEYKQVRLKDIGMKL
jgi:C-terminal processing protease CtpA/Prc